MTHVCRAEGFSPTCLLLNSVLLAAFSVLVILVVLLYVCAISQGHLAQIYCTVNKTYHIYSRAFLIHLASCGSKCAFVTNLVIISEIVASLECFVACVQKLDAAQLRKIQSVDSGLGVSVARSTCNLHSPKLTNGSASNSSSAASQAPARGPTLIEEPLKKLKKPLPQPRPAGQTTNGVTKAEGERRADRSLAQSTSLKSLSDSDTSESKV